MFKNKTMKACYEAAMAAAKDKGSELYWKGEPRRGAGHRCAFWDGFNGRRPAYIARDTMAWAFLRAGEDYSKELKRRTQ